MSSCSRSSHSECVSQEVWRNRNGTPATSSTSKRHKYASRTSLASKQKMIPLGDDLRRKSSESVKSSDLVPATSMASMPSTVSITPPSIISSSSSGPSSRRQKRRSLRSTTSRTTATTLPTPMDLVNEVECFAENFLNKHNRLTNAILKLKYQYDPSRYTRYNRKTVSRELANLIVESRDLNEMLRNTKLMLPPTLVYNFRKHIGQLRVLCGQVRDRLLPHQLTLESEGKPTLFTSTSTFTTSSTTSKPKTDSGFRNKGDNGNGNGNGNDSADSGGSLDLTDESIYNRRLMIDAKSKRGHVESLVEDYILNMPTNLVTFKMSGNRHEYRKFNAAEINDKFITLHGLRDCFIEFRGFTSGVVIKNIKNCTLLFGPVIRTIFVDKMINCTLASPCRFLRLHNSRNCYLYLHVVAYVSMSDSEKIFIAPYNYKYVGLVDDFASANMYPALNNYTAVVDLNWMNYGRPSPNWKLMRQRGVVKRINWSAKAKEFKAALLSGYGRRRRRHHRGDSSDSVSSVISETIPTKQEQEDEQDDTHASKRISGWDRSSSNGPTNGESYYDCPTDG